jgi:pimeloyl-ACP methyl ester carboxylesterase
VQEGKPLDWVWEWAYYYSQGQMLLGDITLVPAEVITEEFRFSNGGVDFFGILTIPVGTDPAPLIINSHGSENAAATAFDWAAAWYAQAGYATLIFDKRGTGQSGGNFSHNFELLASDLNAAVATAAQHPAIDSELIGVGGYSQGVYVTTLAASHNENIKFVIASYGMTESPLVEEMQITQNLFEKAYPEKSWSEFEPFVQACAAAFALEDNERWGEVKQLSSHWRREVSSTDLETTMVGDGCLSWPPFILRLVGRGQLPEGLMWEYDPKPIMASLNVPVIWQFGEADTTAPSATSIFKVQQWISSGKPFVKHSYAKANHGIFLTAFISVG